MCSIHGIILKNEDEPPSFNLSKYLLKSMAILKHRGPDSSGILLDEDVIYFNDFNIDISEYDDSNIGIGHNRLAIVGSATQPIPNEDESIWTVCNGEIYNYYDLIDVLDNHKFKTDTDTEVINHAYEEDILNELDGEYAYGIYDKNLNILILRRDTFGVKPLFYIDRKKYFAFSSEKKGLWNILMEYEGLSFKEVYNFPIKSLPPNSYLTYYIDRHRYDITEDVKYININYFKTKNKDYNIVLKEVESALWDAVAKRVREVDRVGIICSGGVDSTLIGKMASEYSEVVLYSVGIENSEDLLYATRISEDLGLTLRKKIITPEEYEKYLFNVAYCIDEINLMKIGVGIPIYVSSEMAKRDGIKVVLSGQGADELFGGYNRYLRILKENGAEELKKTLYYDILKIHKNNLERDDHCTMANSVELRVPFLDDNLVEIALSLPVRYLIDENVRKKILRDIASKYLPEYIAYRPKKAAQYGSGGEKIVYAVAKKYGYSKKNINKFFEEILFEKVKERYENTINNIINNI